MVCVLGCLGGLPAAAMVRSRRVDGFAYLELGQVETREGLKGVSG